jgi:hypothetical protein
MADESFEVVVGLDGIDELVNLFGVPCNLGEEVAGFDE